MIKLFNCDNRQLYLFRLTEGYCVIREKEITNLVNKFCIVQCKVKYILIYGQNVDDTNIHRLTSITIFSRWILLNSPNLANPDNIPKVVRVTRGITFLAVIVTESIMPLLPLVRYLLPLTLLNRYLPRSSDKNLIVLLHLGMYLLSKLVYAW